MIRDRKKIISRIEIFKLFVSDHLKNWKESFLPFVDNYFRSRDKKCDKKIEHVVPLLKKLWHHK